MALSKAKIDFIKNLVSYDSDEIDADVKTGVITDVLDDLVMDRKASEGSTINNEGIDAQLSYLGYVES